MHKTLKLSIPLSVTPNSSKWYLTEQYLPSLGVSPPCVHSVDWLPWWLVTLRGWILPVVTGNSFKIDSALARISRERSQSSFVVNWAKKSCREHLVTRGWPVILPRLSELAIWFSRTSWDKYSPSWLQYVSVESWKRIGSFSNERLCLFPLWSCVASATWIN